MTEVINWFNYNNNSFLDFCQHSCLSVCQPRVPLCLSFCLCVCLPVWMSICFYPSTSLHVSSSVGNCGLSDCGTFVEFHDVCDCIYICLRACLYICLRTCLYNIFLRACLYNIWLRTCLYICLRTYLSLYHNICFRTCLCICLRTCLYIYTSFCIYFCAFICVSNTIHVSLNRTFGLWFKW